MKNPFFINKGPIKIEQIFKILNIRSNKKSDNFKIVDIKDLENASIGDITFFHSKKYIHLASKTKASYCVTLDGLSQFLPSSCKGIVVNNVLLHYGIFVFRLHLL